MTEENISYLLADTERLQRAADILKAVAHPVRLGIINFLEAGEQPVARICKWLSAPQPYISHHLNLMKAKGILASRRNGSQVLYSVADKNVIEVIHCVRRHGQDREGCAPGLPGNDET
ncbi:MAG: metalloregulator ArsR/SmtB family transcription factor [Syntrophobacteraceae bacterium]